MRLDKIPILLIIAFLLASCSDEKTDYRQIWRRYHHLDEDRMVAFYGEPGGPADDAFGLILEAADGNWDMVTHLTQGSRISEIHATVTDAIMAIKAVIPTTRAAMNLLGRELKPLSSYKTFNA